MGCCEGILKAILIITNVVVMIAGLVLLVAGGIFIGKKFDFFPSLEEYSNNVNAILIPMMVIGGILLLIGLIGCIGAISGKAGLLNVYFIAVLLVVIAEIAVIILAIVKKNDFKDASNKAAKEMFEGYLNRFVKQTEGPDDFSDANALAVNTAQYIFSCCGLTDGPSYWKVSSNTKIPPGCCSKWIGKDSSEENLIDDCAGADLGTAYPDGCKETVNDLVNTMGVVILVVCIAIILFEIVCLVAACYSKKAGHMDEYA